MLYVALTRAKDELILTRSGYFSAASSLQKSEDHPERYFLSDLTKDLYINEDHRMNDVNPNLNQSSYGDYPLPYLRINLD